MSLKVCLLLAFLMAITLFPGSKGTPYSNFLKTYLDNPKSDFRNDETYCNQMIRRRNLNCQRNNTFIHTTQRHLVSICKCRGGALDGKQTSNTLYPITVCTLKKSPRNQRCIYKGEIKIRKIQVTCQKGLPVQYNAYI